MSDGRRARKRRTREHVIADLGVNFVERQALLAGFTMERKVHDYGFDTHLTTYASDGEVENEVVWFQIKATEHANYVADTTVVAVRVDSANLRHWLMDLMPVILVVYDVPRETAFWIEVQEYATTHDLDADEVGETVTLRVPTNCLLTADAMRTIRERKETIRRTCRDQRNNGGGS